MNRIFRWLGRGILGYFLLSFLALLAFAVLPVPLTLTMIPDFFNGNGFHKNWVPLNDISPHMVRAAIAGEDSKFCANNGFEWDAMMQAWKANQSGHRIRGGSTISQQTAKNVFLWQGGGYFRKALEAYFTFLIEHIWGKRRIMEVYLNVAETGVGTYGVEAGSRLHFGHSAAGLTAIEAARMAAILPLPKDRDVVNAHGFVRRHGDHIARDMNYVKLADADACIWK